MGAKRLGVSPLLPSSEQKRANARLIAAAPNMLNALNVALMCMIKYTHRNEVIDNAIKVVDESIKKATNE